MNLLAQSSTAVDGEGSSALTHLQSSVLCDMRASRINLVMVVLLALGSIGWVATHTVVGTLIGLSGPMQAAIEWYQVFAVAMLIIVWPLSALALRWRRRAHVKVFLQKRRSQRLLDLRTAASALRSEVLPNTRSMAA